MFLVPWILILLAVPLRGYDVMMVIGGRYYDHARQAYIELSNVEVDHLIIQFVSCKDATQRNQSFIPCAS